MMQYRQPATRAARIPIHLKGDEDWKKFDEVGVKISNIPTSLTTWQTWQLLSVHGNISRIDILPKRNIAYINYW
jgi:hypothetical protein